MENCTIQCNQGNSIFLGSSIGLVISVLKDDYNPDNPPTESDYLDFSDYNLLLQLSSGGFAITASTVPGDKMVDIIRKTGFNHILEVNFPGDMTIMLGEGTVTLTVNIINKTTGAIFIDEKNVLHAKKANPIL